MDLDTSALIGVVALILTSVLLLVRVVRTTRSDRSPRGPAAAATAATKDARQLIDKAADATHDGDYPAAFVLLEQARSAYRQNAKDLRQAGAMLANVDAREALYRHDYGDYAGALTAMRAAAGALAMPDEALDAQRLTAIRGARLGHEALYLHLLGRDDEALTSAGEGVALLRSAAGDSTSRYAEDIAAALAAHAAAQLGLGQVSDAAATAERAVAVARAARVDALQLATCLGIQARVLARIDPPAAVEAAAAAAEMVRCRSSEPMLMGTAVAWLTTCLGAAGEHDRVLRAAALGEHLLRPFTANPSGRLHLASVLAAKATALAALGRRDKARTCVYDAMAMLGADRGEPWNREAVAALEAVQ